jgi:hypothetical protein
VRAIQVQRTASTCRTRTKKTAVTCAKVFELLEQREGSINGCGMQNFYGTTALGGNVERRQSVKSEAELS